MDTEKLKAVTGAPNEPALHYSEQQKLIGGKSALQRLKGSGGLAATALLATSLLLGACGDEDDCIVTTPPTNTAVNLVLPPIATPADSSTSTPTTPSSSQFTSGTSNGTAQTYCKSRSTGVFYWYSGTRYYSSSGS